jgi:hypothetical protein
VVKSGFPNKAFLQLSRTGSYKRVICEGATVLYKIGMRVLVYNRDDRDVEPIVAEITETYQKGENLMTIWSVVQ